MGKQAGCPTSQINMGELTQGSTTLSPIKGPLQVTPDIARWHSLGHSSFQPHPCLLNISWLSQPLRSKDLLIGVPGFLPTLAGLGFHGLYVHLVTPSQQF